MGGERTRRREEEVVGEGYVEFAAAGFHHRSTGLRRQDPDDISRPLGYISFCLCTIRSQAAIELNDYQSASSVSQASGTHIPPVRPRE